MEFWIWVKEAQPGVDPVWDPRFGDFSLGFWIVVSVAQTLVTGFQRLLHWNTTIPVQQHILNPNMSTDPI